MATYTENYQLHQWEAGDDFLRTDFNEDFEKIDGALGKLATDLGSGGSNCRIAYGTYTGSGTYGTQSKNTLTFDFVPLVVKVFSPEGAYMAAEMLRGGDTAIYNSSNLVLAWGDSSVSWHNTANAYDQLNHSGMTYHYIAFGYSG